MVSLEEKIRDETEIVKKKITKHLGSLKEKLPDVELTRYFLKEYISVIYHERKRKGDRFELAKEGLFTFQPLYEIIDSLEQRKLGYENLPTHQEIQNARQYLERKTKLVKRAENQPKYGGRTPYLFMLPIDDSQMNLIEEWYKNTAVKKRPDRKRY